MTGDIDTKRGRPKGTGRGRGRPPKNDKIKSQKVPGRGRGRPKKIMIVESDDEQMEIIESSDVVDNIVELPPEPIRVKASSSAVKKTDEEKTIETTAKQMESESELRMKRMMEIEAAMTDEIESIVRGKINRPFMASFLTHLKQPAIMQQFDWNFKRVKLGEALTTPNVHMCEICHHPIRVYGRMMHCKHVFCLTCADKQDNCCPRCGEKIYRVEKVKLGAVYMCYHEGTHYGQEGCRRTYLSLRDLQAHIEHRHKPKTKFDVVDEALNKKEDPSTSFNFAKPCDPRLSRSIDRQLHDRDRSNVRTTGVDKLDKSQSYLFHRSSSSGLSSSQYRQLLNIKMEKTDPDEHHDWRKNTSPSSGYSNSYNPVIRSSNTSGIVNRYERKDDIIRPSSSDRPNVNNYGNRSDDRYGNRPSSSIQDPRYDRRRSSLERNKYNSSTYYDTSESQWNRNRRVD